MRPKPFSAAVALGIVLTIFGSMTFSAVLEEPTEASALAAALPGVPNGADTIGLVDPTTGVWHLRTRGGDPVSFYYGNPGDFPIMGDWDCDGIDTPGLYRQSDGYVYLRNSNTQGKADIKFFFGNPGDVPLAGDFNANGCDTVSIWRPTEARIYIINTLGSNDGGLGAADYNYYFGNPGDKPFTGDFNGNGQDTVGLHRESTGFVYFRNTTTTGKAHNQFYFGDAGDRLIAGSWQGTGTDSPAVYRPSNTTIYMRYSNTQGNADHTYQWGQPQYLPVAGRFGTLTPDPLPASCTTFPPDNIWNRRVDSLPLDPRSDQYIASIGASDTLHADFGSGVWPPGSNSPIGIPFIDVPADQPTVPITYTAYGDESDPGPFPVPPDAPIEGGPDATGDRHVIVVDRAACKLYELFNAFPQAGGAWSGSSGPSTTCGRIPCGHRAGHRQMPLDFRSSPGLVTYDEVLSGAITHAIRFTAPDTRNTHLWPARHDASSLTDSRYPPMGQRFRLEAGYDISGYSPQVRVVLQAFKDYGLILADNGAPWFISGAPDPRWDNTMLHEWDDIPGSAFEAVDVSSLMVDPDSGRTSQP